MLSPEQLQAIRERAEKATAGPWISSKFGFQVVAGGRDADGVWYPSWQSVCELQTKYPDCMEQNAEFIAHARTDIPALLSHIEELESKFAVIWRAYTDAVQKNVLLKSNFQDFTPSA